LEAMWFEIYFSVHECKHALTDFCQIVTDFQINLPHLIKIK